MRIGRRGGEEDIQIQNYVMGTDCVWEGNAFAIVGLLSILSSPAFCIDHRFREQGILLWRP